jgi:hypothetical protein
MENSMQRRTSAPKRQEATGGWRKIHDEEFHNFFSSRNIIRMIALRRSTKKWQVAHMWKARNHTKLLQDDLRESNIWERRRHRWDNTIKTNVK